MSLDLDSSEVYRREPYRKAFRIVAEFIQDFKRGFEAGRSVELDLAGLEKILFMGVGGSGIICDVMSQILKERGVYCEVLKDYRLRGGGWDLIMAVSHSGNTAEVLNTVLELLDKDARLLFITSDGILMRIGERYGIPIVPVRGDVPPRYCFPNMLGASLGVFSNLGLVDLDLEYSELERFQEKVREDVPSERNYAKRIAYRIAGGFPVIYAYEEVRCAGYRLKCQLNENAKVYCGFGELPEAFHNDIEALPDNALIILPRSFRESEELRLSIEAFSKLVGEDRVFSIRGDSRRRLGELLELIIFADYTSLYLSILKGSDPLTLPRMDALKKKNRAYGMIKEEATKRIEDR